MKYPSESKRLLWVFLSSVLIVYDKTKLKTTTGTTPAAMAMIIATTNGALGGKKEASD